MTNQWKAEHLSAERIQAFLDGLLSRREAAAVQEHAHWCARCQAELDVWMLLFRELEDLPQLEPSPGFIERVLVQRTAREKRVRLPVAARVRSRLVHVLGGRGTADRHPEPDRLQDLLDGILLGPELVETRAHLAACSNCRTEMVQWRELAAHLEGLSNLAPSPGFEERVMARVRARAPAVATAAARSRSARLWSRVGALRPRTRRAWAVACGVVVAPTAAASALAYFVLSHPALTPGYLLSFLWWQLSGFAVASLQALLGGVVESATVFRMYTMVQFLMETPQILVAALGTFTLLTLWAVRVLYHNLLDASATRRRYAHASF